MRAQSSYLVNPNTDLQPGDLLIERRKMGIERE